MIVIFGAAIVAPPAHAELVAISVILAAAFTSAILVNEAVKTESDVETDSKQNETDSMQQVGVAFSKFEPAAPQ